MGIAVSYEWRALQALQPRRLHPGCGEGHCQPAERCRAQDRARQGGVECREVTARQPADLRLLAACCSLPCAHPSVLTLATVLPPFLACTLSALRLTANAMVVG